VDVYFTAESDGTCSGHSEGQCTYSVGTGSETDTWSGSGSIPWPDGYITGVIDTQNRILRIYLTAESSGIFTYTTRCPDGTICADGFNGLGWQVGDDGFQDGVRDDGTPVVNVPFDQDWNIVAGQKQKTASSADYPSVTLSWGDAPPESPPDESAGR
jgi:hypothetical protein